MDDEEHVDEHANANGATVIDRRVDWSTEDLKQEPDGRLVLEDVGAKASDKATKTRGVVALCEECGLSCAARRHGSRSPLPPWSVLEPGAGMMETVVAEVPSSLKGGMFREVWVCSDRCERVVLGGAGLDPSTAGLR